MKRGLTRQIWILLFAATVAMATPIVSEASEHDAATDSVVGRLSKDQLDRILAGAEGEQRSRLSAELMRDGNALGAALAVFQKNYSGSGGFWAGLRNPQLNKLPAAPFAARITELKKRLGKGMPPKEPSDVAEMASVAGDCVDFLSSPSLVSYMEPPAAGEIRNTANLILGNMDEAVSGISGVPLGVLLARTKQDLSELDRTLAGIPAEVDGIRAIESALDRGNVRLAIDNWTKLTTEHVPQFKFAMDYVDANRSLFADLKHFETCESPLSGLMSTQSKVAHAQALLLFHECRASATGKLNTTAFLDGVEPSISQAVRDDFGTLPTDSDLKDFISASVQPHQETASSQTSAPPGETKSQVQQESPATSEEESPEPSGTSEASSETSVPSSDSQSQVADTSSHADTTTSPQSDSSRNVPESASSSGFPLWPLFVGIALLGFWAVAHSISKQHNEEDISPEELEALERLATVGAGSGRTQELLGQWESLYSEIQKKLNDPDATLEHIKPISDQLLELSKGLYLLLPEDRAEDLTNRALALIQSFTARTVNRSAEAMLSLYLTHYRSIGIEEGRRISPEDLSTLRGGADALRTVIEPKAAKYCDAKRLEQIREVLARHDKFVRSLEAVTAKETRSPYQVLGVSPTASSQEIKQAYKEKAKRLHPDVLPVELKEAAEDKFGELQAAYEELAGRENRESEGTQATTKEQVREDFVSLTNELTYKILNSAVTQEDIDGLRAAWRKLEPNLADDDRQTFQGLFRTVEGGALKTVSGELDIRALAGRKTSNQALAEFTEFLKSLSAKFRIGPDALFEEDLAELQDHWQEIKTFMSADQISEHEESVSRMEATIETVLAERRVQ